MGASPDGDVRTTAHAVSRRLLRAAGSPQGCSQGFSGPAPAGRFRVRAGFAPRCAQPPVHSVIPVNFLRNGRGIRRGPATGNSAGGPVERHPSVARDRAVGGVRGGLLRGGSAVGLKEAERRPGIGEAGRADASYDEASSTTRPWRTCSSRRGPARWTRPPRTKAAADAVDRDAGAARRRRGRASPIPAPDGTRAARPGHDEPATRRPPTDRVQPLRDATAAVQDANPGVRVEETGGPSISKALDETLGKDFKKAEFLSLPVTLAILVVAFGALIAAGVPVLLALSSVAARDRPVDAGLAPGPGDRRDQQRDPADRHGRRRRLLAVLPAARTRGTGHAAAATSTRSRSPPRRPATRSSSPASRSSSRWPGCSWPATRSSRRWPSARSWSSRSP